MSEVPSLTLELAKEDIFKKDRAGQKPVISEIQTGNHPDLKGGKFKKENI